MIDREKAKNTFLEYVSEFDLEDVKAALKVEHTMRVTDLCCLIAKSEGLEGEDADLAYLAGLLHDIGRFEQLKRYHTFIDAVSVNHAKLSADLLFRDGLIRRFYGEKGYKEFDEILEKAVRLHNVYILPRGLNERELTICKILRDADKIDIIRVNIETPMTQIYDLPMEEFLSSEISEPVYEDLIAHRNVNRANSRTGIDYILGHTAFVYGLEYPVSYRIIEEQGYLEKMLSFKSENPITQAKLVIIRDEIRRFVAEKSGESGAAD